MKIIFAVMLALLSTLGASAQDLKSVQKIYVGAMGKSDEAERFRLLLGDQLTKKGFTVVDDQSKADGTLSGVLAVRVYDDDSVARATVILSSADGVRLWSKDFGPHFGFKNKKGSDPVGYRAQDVASELHTIIKIK